MKHDQLCAIAYNLADSLASGLCFVIGYFPTDVFGEAEKNVGRAILIDFLSGRITRGRVSQDLERAVALFAEAFPEFCQKHGASASEFSELTALFLAGHPQNRVFLSVTDQSGRRSRTEYVGVPLKRMRMLDPHGRIRRVPRSSIAQVLKGAVNEVGDEARFHRLK